MSFPKNELDIAGNSFCYVSNSEKRGFMGLLRMYLAVCVIAAHSESVVPWSLHDGREAVQVFFIISGFYMQLILSGKKYASIWKFYLSRFVRIFTSYYVCLLIVIAASVLSGKVWGQWLTLASTRGLSEGWEEPGFGSAFACMSNISLFFQDWVMFAEQRPGGALAFTPCFREGVNQLWNFLWIPQAWSVGVELTFYIAAPFLARRFSAFALAAVAGVSLAIRVWFYTVLGLQIDPWVYRFLPFELLHFSYGMLGCRVLLAYPKAFEMITSSMSALQSRLGSLYIPAFLTAGLAALWFHCEFVGSLRRNAASITSSGDEWAYLASLALWGLLVPIVFAMTRNNLTDRAVGELSYPVYLLHYSVCRIILLVFSWLQVSQHFRGEAATVVTVGIAFLVQVSLLNRIEAWRQKLASGELLLPRHA